MHTAGGCYTQAFHGVSQWERAGRALLYQYDTGRNKRRWGDLEMGTGPSVVGLGTELWNPGFLAPMGREVHVSGSMVSYYRSNSYQFLLPTMSPPENTQE